MTDTTNDPKLTSWIESGNDDSCDFPIQNLPYGVFTRTGSDVEPRIGVAIGDQILDVKGAIEHDVLTGLDPKTQCALYATTLNDFMRLGRDAWTETRRALSALLRTDADSTLKDDAGLREDLLVPMAEATMHLPATIGDYTDFYASVHHAANIGSMFRPDNPLLPNYKHLPVGYHGRASSIVVSGTPVRRPMGQLRLSDDEAPVFGPCRLLDYEMEMGFFVGPGNDLGRRVPIGEARDHIFGMVVVNDWSARDIQKWEYQPLGPFNAKNFATSISPWVVTMDALDPFRVPGPPRENIAGEDPPVLDYLRPADDMSLDMTCEVAIRSERMRDSGREPMVLSRGNFREMYWTVAQMLVHHTSTGCNLRPGDLIASGTLSGPAEDSRGSMLERTWRGQKPITLPDGSERKLLADGDEVIMRAVCAKDGARRIGFGECRGIVLPAE